MKYNLIAICSFVVVSLSAVVQPAQANCWKKIASDQLQHEWRKDNKERYIRIEGAFTKQGKTDYAEIEKSCDGNRAALFAYISSENGKHEKIYLAEIPRNQLDAFGVRLVEVGNYQGACSKEYAGCVNGFAELKLVNDAVELFKEESASSILFWDETLHKFHRLWTSD